MMVWFESHTSMCSQLRFWQLLDGLVASKPMGPNKVRFGPIPLMEYLGIFEQVVS